MKRSIHIKKTIVLMILMTIFIQISVCQLCVASEVHRSIEHSSNYEKVKVGYCEMPGFEERDSRGNYSGYGYHYFETIAQYAGWECEYVCTNWNSAVEMLEKGEIDLLAPFTKNRQSEMKFDFPDSSMGKVMSYLITRNNGDIAYEDFKQFNGMKVGVVRGNTINEGLKGYCDKNSFTVNTVEYSTFNELCKALDNGEVDSALISNNIKVSGYRIIAKFDSKHFYIAVAKGKDELLQELNYALSEIKLNNSELEGRLKSTYLGDGNADYTPVFTEEEKTYIKQHSNIKILYDANWSPMEYKNEKTGEFNGILGDVFKEVSSISGLKFQFVAANNYNEMLQLCKKDEINMVAAIPYDFNKAKEYNCLITEPFMTMPSILMYSTEKSSLKSVAVARGYYLDELVKSNIGSEYSIQYYDTSEQCMEAVAEGTAKYAMVNIREADYYSSMPKYRGFKLKGVMGRPQSLSMGIIRNQDPVLFSIINKSLKSISKEKMNALVRTAPDMSRHMSLIDFMYNNPVQCIIAFTVVAVGIIMIIVLLILNKKGKDANELLSRSIEQAEQANKAKSMFLSKMSHEIRTPMNAIVGITAIAKNYTKNNNKMDQYISKIEDSSRILLGIINDVLDMSAIESDKLKIASNPFDIQKMLTTISDIYYLQCKQKGIEFSMITSKIVHEKLIGDELRVNQILMNLLSNAYKFTERGGKIKVEVRERSCLNNNVFLSFTVQDTGSGMSKELLERAFKPFEQESADTAIKHGGSGLGLSITKNLVELMKGAIDVQSEKGKGTIFTVDIPFVVNDIEDTRKLMKLEDIKVLVVDDDKENVEYAAMILKRIGVKYSTAISGDEALELLQCHNENSKDYNICFIDWKMPGMGGIEVTRKIRNLMDKDTLIIIVSAYDLSEIEEEARKAGADMFIQKPLFQSTVFNLLMSLNPEYHNELSIKREKYDFSGKRILLAEDNILNTEIAVELLNMVNLEVCCTKNGEEVVEQFLRSEPGTYDAILMDIQMPIIDGYEATRRIRKSKHDQARSIPIFAMTANAFTEDISASLSAGMNGHIAKPIDTKVLYETLKGVI